MEKRLFECLALYAASKNPHNKKQPCPIPDNIEQRYQNLVYSLCGCETADPTLITLENFTKIVATEKNMHPFFLSGRGYEKKVEIDTNNRAVALCQQFYLNKNITKIMMMDGHGRIILQFLQCLVNKLNSLTGSKKADFKARLATLKICVMDIDDGVLSAHQQIFFPSFFEHVKGDILNRTKTPDRLFYLNFCGIASQEEKIHEFIEKNYGETVVFLSFSVGRGASQKMYKETLQRVFPEMETVSTRGDFETVKF
jgi:hypothetical protein